MSKRATKGAENADAGAGESRSVPGGALHTAAVGAGVVAAFVAVALWIAAPAFDGTFLSDDYFYIVNNVYLHTLSWENVVAIFDPAGEPAIYTINYAPLHLLAHAVEWALWGEQTRGYHVVNAVLHGVTSALLIPLFVSAGVPLIASVLAAALFLVHPANVETVAWIFQLKTIVSLALALGALLLFERRPAWALGLFAAAILTKITAIFALPVVMALSWSRQVRGDGNPRWGWVAAWAVFLLVVSVPEMIAFQRQSDVRIVIHEDPLVHARTIVAIAMRYLVMAFTGTGVSTFHEPPPAVSWLDPWWLSGLVVLALLGWRMAVTLWRGETEAAYWIFAAGAFAPVSQVFPFIFPMGDRYLYTILPGLYGGVMLAAAPAWRAVSARLEAALPDQASLVSAVPRATAVAAALLAVLFAVRSHDRATVFRDGRTMLIDAALHYPDGMQAAILRGHSAAERGDAVASARAFQVAVELGFSDLAALADHPQLAGVRTHPAFQAVLRGLARRDIERLSQHEWLSQGELLMLHVAYLVDGDRDAARRALEQGLEQGGPLDDQLRRRLQAMGPERGRDRPQP